MADGDIEIKTKIDTDGTEKALNKLSKKLSSIADNKTLTSLSKLGNAVTGVKSAFSMITGAMGKAADAINETIELANKQIKAETMLEAAAKNNPFLNDSNVQSLKNYASELQKIGTIGDEELLPFMAQLAAAGRNQSEIQEIMSAALNASASGMISMESAVQSLNRSYSGEIGMLGRILPGVKELTAEQLKNGEAVKFVSKSFEGMAQQVAGKTGGWQQFKNSLGDLKEVIGSGFANAQNKAGKILSGFFDTITEKLKSAGNAADEFKKKLGLITQNDSEDASTKSIQNELDLLKKEKELIEKRQLALKGEATFVNQSTKENKKVIAEYDAEIKRLTDVYTDALSERNKYKNDIEKWNELTFQVNKASVELQNYQSVNKEVAKAAENSVKDVKKEWAEIMKSSHLFTTKSLDAELSENEKRTSALEKRLENIQKKEANANSASKRDEESEKINKQDMALKSIIADIEKRAEVEGKEVDLQEVLNAKINTYMAVWKESGSWAKTYLSNLKTEIDDLSASMLENAKDLELTIDEINALSSGSELRDSIIDAGTSQLEKAKQAADVLEHQFQTLIEWTEMTEAEKAEIEDRYRKAKLKADAETWDEELNIASNFITAYTSAISEISSMLSERFENEATIETAALEKQYSEGLISEEEYQKKKEDIEEEAAEKAYKLQLWTWSANLLQIGVSTAQAVVSALKDYPGPVGIAMAATYGALGAAQLAVAAANKPIPPSFYTGGVVGGMNGASMGGDNTYIHARNGEMILNAKQQRSLWETANGAGSGGIGLNVNVKNYASNDVSTSQQLTADGLEIAITRIMEKNLSNGSLNGALTSAQNSMSGISYTN